MAGVKGLVSGGTRRLLRVLPAPLLPATTFLAVLLVAPLVLLFSFGFVIVDRGVVTGELTLAVYLDLIGNPFFGYLFGRTLLLALLVTSLCLLFGYPIAYLYHRSSGIWRSVILVSVAAPLLTSALVRAFAWIVILGGQGFLNNTLLALDVVDSPIRLLFTWNGVLIGMTQVLLPFMIVPLIGALGQVPRDLEYAARNLGAGAWHAFWKVTVPQTLPGIAAGVSLVFVLAYSEFTVSVLMGGATFNVASIYIFESMTTLLEWSRGAALASILLVSSLTLVTVFNLFIRRITRWNEAST